MIFKRYSSPFLFLNKLLEIKKFNSGITALYNQIEEEKLWQLYLSNPIKEKSYLDWKNEVFSSNTQHEEIDLEVAKDKAINILKNFKPE